MLPLKLEHSLVSLVEWMMEESVCLYISFCVAYDIYLMIVAHGPYLTHVLG